MYPGLGLQPPALAPVVDALAARSAAFGINFIVPLMARESLELAAERAPYVDFFLADRILRSSQRSMRAAGSAAGRSSRTKRREPRRLPGATS